MKCQNCGRNEVNFHYSSNINGTVTEAHLCSECAAKSGYDTGSMFKMGGIFDDFFPSFGRARSFMPLMGVNIPVMFGMLPQMGILVQNEGAGCSCGNHAAAIPERKTEVDEQMSKRREINIIREQMLNAAKNEEYEKAAELRDKLKEMEGQT